MERWRKIRGWDFYEVSNFGNVRSLTHTRIGFVKRLGIFIKRPLKGKVLKPGIYKGLGYKIVILNQGKKRKTLYVHLLVAEAFLPPRPCGHEIDHIDSNRANAHYKNLEWKTHAENSQHSIDTGSRRVFVGFGGRRMNEAIFTN